MNQKTMKNSYHTTPKYSELFVCFAFLYDELKKFKDSMNKLDEIIK